MFFKLSIFDDTEIDFFMNSVSNKLLFQSYKYFKFLKFFLSADDYSFVYVNSKKEIEGVFFLLGKDGPVGTVLNSLPFYGSNSGAISNCDEIKIKLIKEYNKVSSGDGIAASTVINSPIFKDHELYENNVIFDFKDSRIGQITKIPLIETKDDLMPLFHSKTRNMIRKSIKLDIKIKKTNDMMDFIYNTHVENMLSVGGIAKEKKFFSLIPDFFIKDKDYNIYTAYMEKKPIASLLVFYSDNVVEYFTPVILNEYRNTQALSQIIFEVMALNSKKYKFWNWGGTWGSQDGVYRFKSRWGAQDINYYYFTKINDKDILYSPSKTLIDNYPNFFVLPFDQLRKKNE